MLDISHLWDRKHSDQLQHTKALCYTDLQYSVHKLYFSFSVYEYIE